MAGKSQNYGRKGFAALHPAKRAELAKQGAEASAAKRSAGAEAPAKPKDGEE